MPHGLRTLGKGFIQERLERGERMLLARGGMLKQGKHSVGPFLMQCNVCALTLCLSTSYVTPKATPFAQMHPYPRRAQSLASRGEPARRPGARRAYQPSDDPTLY